MTTQTLVIEKIWSYPPESCVFFLEKCGIYMQIRNRSGHTLRLEKVECHFETEDGVEPYIPSRIHFETLEHGHLSGAIRVDFEADLALKAHTNYYRIVIYYHDGDRKVLEYSPQKFLVFYPLGPGEQHFFISHKDDEDTNVGRHLAGFLKKLGFIGYLSEDDHRPGMDLWQEKIPVAVASSIGVIILWTSNAAKNPAKIYREIEMAKSNGKRLIMAPEQGVGIPDVFPIEIEYFRLENPITTSQLKKLACSIEETYRRGGYS